MKKVLFLIHALGGGGAEKILVNLANGMDKNQYDVTVMTVVDTGIFRNYLAEDVRYKTIISNPFKKREKQSKEFNNVSNPGNVLSKSNPLIDIIARLYVFLWKWIPTKLIYKIAIRDKYDIEIAFLEGICSKLISSSTNRESKKISWIHVDLINHKKSEAIFKGIDDEKKCYNKFDEIVCVSNTVREQFIKKYSYDSEKTLVRYNPIDNLDIIKKSKEKVTDIEKPNKPVLCSIGRLVTQKGFDRLLRVHKEVIQSGYEHELWIIGEGNKRPGLEKFIEENNLSESVKLLGFKSNPYKYLNLADIFICSSRAEGFSTVASEAIVLGKPVVTVNCSGMKELLGENNEYGIVTENSEEEFQKGIEYILKYEEIFKKYKLAAEERSIIFDYKTAVKSIEDLC